jgi:MOSC domain-containing protein YiiM
MRSISVISVNVGLPRLVEYNGEPVATGIFKEPVGGIVKVNELNLEGDRQADLRVHGGRFKAVYVYPAEHYEFWERELPGVELPWGVFGENLTVRGLVESEVCPGDRLRVGTAEFTVTQPRYPCFKLGIRFGRKDMIRRFAESGRTGFYLAVEKTGELSAGYMVEHFRQNGGRTIAQIAAERLSTDR